MGGGNLLAFFWFEDAPDPVPGVTTAVTSPGIGEFTTAVGTMNFACWLRELAQPGDLGREPRTAADRVTKV